MNNFAISSGGVGDALLNSASALAAANNTLDESIALITAANETIQNPEKVGKNLPNGTVMCRKKTAISVKGRRRFRPRKDFVALQRIRNDCNTLYGNILVPLSPSEEGEDTVWTHTII